MSADAALASELGLSSGRAGPPGLLVAFEALDGTPRQNVIERVRNHLLPCDTIIHKFPQKDTAIGTVIDSYLKCRKIYSAQTAHLLFASERWEHSAMLEQKLRAGSHVLVNRYSLSGIVYSLARMGIGYMDFCKQTEAFLPRPDLTIYLRLEPEEVMKLRGYGRARNHALPNLFRVDSLYQEFIRHDDTGYQIECGKLSEQEIVEKCLKLIHDTTPMPKSRNLRTEYDVNVVCTDANHDLWGMPY